jgi:hypothetical protein
VPPEVKIALALSCSAGFLFLCWIVGGWRAIGEALWPAAVWVVVDRLGIAELRGEDLALAIFATGLAMAIPIVLSWRWTPGEGERP